MANYTNQTSTLIDSAIGPLLVVEEDTDTDNYDVDDYVHDMAVSQAITLQLYNAAQNADPNFAADRFPVSIGGTIVGGVG